MEHALREATHCAVPVVTIKGLVTDDRPIDLLHMDIQGGELDFLSSSIDQIDQLVAYVVVGTHSREIEGSIFRLMLSRGWVLEIERAALLHFPYSEPQVLVDGVQAWRNPRIRP